MSDAIPTRHRTRPCLLELDARIVPSFTPLTTFTTGVISATVAASADFNLDGRDDLAVFNSNGGTAGAQFIAVLLSNGDGQFTQSAALSGVAGSSPTSIITADFNGDGIPDLASGSDTAMTLRVYLGNGNGTFAQSFFDALGTVGLGAGDFNGDGRTDIVALQGGGATLRIYLGNGAGQFAASAPLTSSFFNSRILTGDLDNNGTVDFLATDNSGLIVAYLGNGNGTFAAPVITNTTGFPSDFTLGQFDGDARLDVVTTESGNLVLHSGLGAGLFNGAGVAILPVNSSGILVASTDFNSDGRPDVVATDIVNQANAANSNGDGTFAADTKNPYQFTTFSRDLVTGDFDGDSHPDFAVLGNAVGQVFLNDLPDATVTTLTATPFSSFVGMPVTLTATVATAFQGHDTPQGTVTFTAGTTVLGTATLVNGVATITVATLPAGIYQVVAMYSGSAAVFVGTTGNVAPRGAALRASQSAPARVIVKNYDTPEFASGSDNGSVICYHDAQINRLRGYDNFGGPFTGVRPALGDFNGDGASDIAVGSSPGIEAQVSVVDGLTKQVLMTAKPFPGFRGGLFIAAADFNGDGIADLAVGTDAGAQPHVKVFLTLGGTLVEVASFYAFGEGFRGGVRLAAGDVNGDGTPDLIVGAGAGAGPSVAVFDGLDLLRGTARRLANDFYAYAADFTGGVFVAAGDVNRDGYADIVTGAGLGAPHVTVVSGLSLLRESPTLLASYFAADPGNLGGIRVAARDLNRDGYSDVIAAAGVGNGSTAWTFSGATLTQFGIAAPTSAEDVFPGLYAGIYVG